MELQEAFVSQLVGRPVVLVTDGTLKRIGRIEDVALAGTDESYPPVIGFYVKCQDGVIRYAPFNTVESVTDDTVVVTVQPKDRKYQAARNDELLLKKELFDTQIVDVDGRKVVRVNDLKLAPAGDQLRLIAADIGLSGMLRRLSPKVWGQRWLERAMHKGPHHVLISWEAVQPLRRYKPGDVIRLRVPRGKIERIHPVDLAAMIEELNAADRASLVESLDEEVAADALEQLEVEQQLSILEDLKPDRAADIIEHMVPDDAADLLAEIEPEQQEEILELMEPKEAEEVRELLAHDEATAGGLMTTEYLSIPAGLTVGEAFDHIRKAAKDAELVYYVYVLDEKECILGVVSLRDMITVNPQTPVAEISTDDVVTLPLGASREEVVTTIARYDFMAVPVVDKQDRIQGIVTVDDAVDVLLPERLRRMFPRVGKSRSAAKTKSS